MQNDCYQTQDKDYVFNTYARYPITLVKGEGAFVWDNQGKKYLDFLSGIACTILGHAHPEITQAITEQAQTILHTSNLYFSPPNIELAKYLVAHGGLDKIFFCNSGAEANEAAIKLARKYHWVQGNKNKSVILSATHSFHGRTLGALAATAKLKLQEGFGPLPPAFRYESWQDTDKFCQAIDENVAAVILEPIQGEGGIHVAPPGFLEAVRTACNKTGALLIFDEIQCGIGRTGELFAYQHFGVKPDIITLAKGIANGLPLGVVCALNQVANALSPGDHGTTFGGNPVSCKAALTTLNILLNQNYLPRVKHLGNYLLTQLKTLQQKFPEQIKEIRGRGLMIGIELTKNPKQILAHCQESGLLANITADNVLRLLPPYIINEADIDVAVAVLAQSFKIIYSGSR
jgi:predicted acetylornithine/succinylornithine family transaminase